MSAALAYAVGLLVLAGLVLHERQFWRLLHDEQRRTIADLTNRLLAAQAEGKIIPPSELQHMPAEPEIELDPAIEEWVSQWEDPTVQQRWRLIARGYVVQGLSAPATVKALEQRLAR